MKVYALVGKSGTGKSFQAMNLCRDLNIENIVDDGLFIHVGEILAGVSAKRQATKVGAIKTALFINDEHRVSVAAKIKEIAPKSLLLLGTSDAMVERIAKSLELPEISERVYIEQITTEAEREIARRQRKQHGKHVIPVPTFQLKREFSGYFLDPLRIFKGFGLGRGGVADRSVVRPTYSYLGDFIISDKVIGDIALYICQGVKGVCEVARVNTETTGTGIRISLQIIGEYGVNVVEVAKEAQSRIVAKVENMTAFNVDGVDVEIKGLAKAS